MEDTAMLMELMLGLVGPVGLAAAALGRALLLGETNRCGMVLVQVMGPGMVLQDMARVQGMVLRGTAAGRRRSGRRRQRGKNGKSGNGARHEAKQESEEDGEGAGR